MAIPKAGPEPLVELEQFLEPFGSLVLRSESRETLERYTTGLLSDVGRKNAAELGRALPGTNSQRLQEFLTRTAWDSWEMDRLRIEILRAHASVGEGVLILDDTGFAKKGRHSVGVARQYSGTLGRVDNCQVLVTAHYVDRVFDWPVSSRLYLPESWVKDRERRAAAQVPEEVGFATKGEIGLELVDRARAAEVPFGAVVVDAGYGDQPVLLDGLVEREIAHVAAVSRTVRFRLASEVETDPGDAAPPPYSGRGRPRKALGLEERVEAREARELLRDLTPEAWRRIAWRDGVKGPLVKEFAAVKVYRSGSRGKHLPVRGLLLGERPVGGEDAEFKCYFAWSLDSLDLEALVDLTHVRWVIERFYQDAKGELGLDDYEGRLWTGFHRHVALVMLAHSFLTLQQAYAPEVLERPPRKRAGAGAPHAPPLARGFPPTGAKKRGRSPTRRS